MAEFQVATRVYNEHGTSLVCADLEGLIGRIGSIGDNNEKGSVWSAGSRTERLIVLIDKWTDNFAILVPRGGCG